MGVKFGTENVLYFPRNISDIFKATWKASNTSVFKNTFKFTQTSGNIVFSLTNRENTFIPAIDLVQGDMLFRDGEYSTDPALKYTLQGVYFWQIGVLFMVGNPSDYPIVEDFVLDLVANTTILDSISIADSKAVIQLAQRNLTNATMFTNTDSLCFFTFLFQFQAVSAEFNEKWAFLYRDPRYNSGEIQKPELLFDSIITKTPNCELEFSIFGSSFMFENYYNKAINYVVMIGFAAFVEILLTIRQMETSSTQSYASKVSMLTIGQQATMDSYLCLIHLTTGIAVENVFNAFATAAFFKFILFSMFELRYVFTIWKARRPQAFSEWGLLRRELGLMYIRFYAVLMIGLLIVYFIGALLQLFILLLYSFWIPQIYCNIERDSSKGVLHQYVIGMSITRLLIPLYFYACSENFAHTEPRFGFSVLLVCWVIAQVIFLFIQDRYGPRFFIPRRLLPPKYDYQHDVALPTGETAECVICMSQVELDRKDYMVTPCNHIFHQPCLLQWLNQKMECPTCRHALPNV